MNGLLLGEHNIHNALAAIAAAHHVGVPIPMAIESLANFKNVKRRLELRGMVKEVAVYDDFAHHPTAISATIDALRASVGNKRILAVLECGSYTMRTGVHKNHLDDALIKADAAYILRPKQADWDMQKIVKQAAIPIKIFDQIEDIVKILAREAKPGDQILIMSNSAFGGIHEKLLKALSS